MLFVDNITFPSAMDPLRRIPQSPASKSIKKWALSLQYIRSFFSKANIIDMFKQAVVLLAFLALSLTQCPASYNINNLIAGIFPLI
jgi:hypothetical protein